MSVSLIKEKDSVLVKGYINGCERSLAVLIERHKLKIYNFIYSKVFDRDIAEDIFQDTFIKVIKTLRKGAYQEEGKFLPWVMRISHNLVIDHFRKESKMRKIRPNSEFDIFDVIDDGSKNQEQIMIQTQVHSDLKTLIEKLPTDQKEVLKMRYFEDLSFKEISDLTNSSINTALGRMRYALINLRKLAEKQHIDLQVK